MFILNILMPSLYATAPSSVVIIDFYVNFPFPNTQTRLNVPNDPHFILPDS